MKWDRPVFTSILSIEKKKGYCHIPNVLYDLYSMIKASHLSLAKVKNHVCLTNDTLWKRSNLP